VDQSALLLLVVRLGFLALLWLFVFGVVRAIRADIFGPRVPRASRANRAARAAAPRPAPPPQRPRPAKSLPRHLVVTQGGLAGTTLELTDAPVTIGRAEGSTLVLQDDYASNHHARLFPANGQWVLEDLGSTNGTFLDRTKVSSPTPIGVGSKVRIGQTVLELRK
jgi:pSer/pThr/pTyr-binding forkhead associated (FHA) protein